MVAWGRILCVLALLLASPYGDLAAGVMGHMPRVAVALLLGIAGIVLWSTAGHDAQGASASTADAQPGAALSPRPRSAATGPTMQLIRHVIALAICVGTWIVPALLVEAANGIDRSDQALGRVFVTLLVSFAMGPVLAWLFLRMTHKRTIGDIARERARREAAGERD